MSVVIVQDEILHYEVLGRGRPLIFLHGWVGSWRYWIPTMQVASFTFRAYALDLWGFGDSAKCSPRYSITEQAKLVDAFMDQMGIPKIGLVGHGLGAVVAMNFAACYPALVDRLMVVSVPWGDHSVNARLRASTTAELSEWLLNRTQTPDAAREAARSEAAKADFQAIAASLADLQTLDPLNIARQFTTPCLFVHGQNDPAIVVPQLEDVTTLPEHIHQIIFDQSGHFPMLDENNKFNRLLTDFLNLASGESPRQLQLKEEWKRRVR